MRSRAPTTAELDINDIGAIVDRPFKHGSMKPQDPLEEPELTVVHELNGGMKLCIGSPDGNAGMHISTIRLITMVRRIGLGVLRMGEIDLCINERDECPTLTVSRSGVGTGLELKIPHGGDSGQILELEKGEIFLYSEKDGSRTLLFPLPGQRSSHQRPKSS